MLAFVFVIVVLQLWLLTAIMNAYLGGDEGVVEPAALVSRVGCALNVGLLRYVAPNGRRRGDPMITGVSARKRTQQQWTDEELASTVLGDHRCR